MSRRSLFPALGLAVAAFAFTLLQPAMLHAQSADFNEYTDSHPDSTTFTESVLVDFTAAGGAEPGGFPEYGSLVQANDGNYYGMTESSGANNDGVICESAPTCYRTWKDDS